jgi:hypothetical protein
MVSMNRSRNSGPATAVRGWLRGTAGNQDNPAARKIRTRQECYVRKAGPDRDGQGEWARSSVEAQMEAVTRRPARKAMSPATAMCWQFSLLDTRLAAALRRVPRAPASFRCSAPCVPEQDRAFFALFLPALPAILILRPERIIPFIHWGGRSGRLFFLNFCYDRRGERIDRSRHRCSLELSRHRCSFMSLPCARESKNETRRVIFDSQCAG